MFTHVESFKSAFLEKLETMYGKSFKESTTRDQYNTLGYMVREYMNSQWIATNESYRSGERKQMYYLSIEFLLGRLLGSNILNLGIKDVCEQGLSEPWNFVATIRRGGSRCRPWKWWTWTVSSLFP